MRRYVILAQSKCTAAALAAWGDLVGLGIADTEQHVADDYDKLRIFESSSEFLRDKLANGHSLAVFVDALDLRAVNPCLSGGGWNVAMGMLILAFPEVHWMIGMISGAENERIKALHGLHATFAEPFSPLYDASGLRQWVRKETKDQGKTVLPFAFRTAFACALDDEPAYAHFHAYAAYRFGFQALPIETEKLALAVLGMGQLLRGWPERPDLAIEDFFLNYPDRQTREHWSDLAVRVQDGQLMALDCADLRVFVTSGQRRGTSSESRRATRLELRRLRDEGRLGKLVPKPIAGIFDLWRACGLASKFKRKHGYHPSFDWPPKYESDDDSIGDHSAPGALLLIANSLIARAKELEDVDSVTEAVRGAVLANNALELLADKTPTTALEALALKHRFEVMAECRFYGVQSHFDVRTRVAELDREINAIGKFFSAENRTSACWNAEAMILGDLIDIFDDHNQFDESIVLQARARRVHRRLWAKRDMKVFGDQLRWLNPVYWVAAYTDGLLRSIPAFVVILFLWVAGLGLLFGTYSPEGESSNRWTMGVQDGVTSFFSIGAPIHERPEPWGLPPTTEARDAASTESIAEELASIRAKLEGPDRGYTALICVSIIAGFFHLGIFISHLYTIASRK